MTILSKFQLKLKHNKYKIYIVLRPPNENGGLSVYNTNEIIGLLNIINK